MKPPHHAPGGGFRDPWPDAPGSDRRLGGFLRWRLERLFRRLPPTPDPEDVPAEAPRPAWPRGDADEARLTWIGHATFLVQVAGLNLLTDPHLSRRASPVPWAGPRRLRPPGLGVEELPPLDAVLLSHDHYDHLDRPSVWALHGRFGPGLRWLTPVGYRDWFARLGIGNVTELDWWEETSLDGPDGARARVVAVPARHWTRRGLRADRRLWASWVVQPPSSGAVLFVGDSGHAPCFAEIGRRLGPFRASVLPVGAYDPRWFMRPAHMDPEEAVRAYLDLGGSGAFVASHWGTFRLTDEDVLEPPRRLAAAWREARLPADRLRVPGVGGTAVV